VDEKSTITPGNVFGLPVTNVPVVPEFNRMLTSLDGLFPSVNMIEAFNASGDKSKKA
jgi:hypothetical protein